MAAGRSAAIMIAVTAAVCPLVFAGAGQGVAGTWMAASARAVLGATWQTAQQVPARPQAMTLRRTFARLSRGASASPTSKLKLSGPCRNWPTT
jgi:hypothetical protein